MVTVTAADGAVLWQADPRPQQVIDPPVASAAIDILSDAVLYGTGNAANIGRPQFGKTGTDDTNVNAWFVGAIPQLTAAVWVGYHAGQIPDGAAADPHHGVRAAPIRPRSGAS